MPSITPIALTLCSLALTVTAAPELWMTHAMDRVFRGTTPSAWDAKLQAGRGEWEALQIIVTGSPEEVREAVLSAGCLKGPNDTLIPAPVLLREHYVAITQTSESSSMAGGMYPDALVPQTFPTQALPTLERVSQPFWVDVYVPPDAKPGDYSGTLTITLPDGQKLTRDYSLHVWDFQMPRLPTLKSSIFVTWRRLAKIHGFDDSGSTAPPPLQKILNDYYDMLVDHRLSPHEVWATYPDGTDPLSEESFAHMEHALREHLLHRQAGTIGLPLWLTWPVGDPLGKDRKAALAYAARWFQICQKLGCADRLYKIFGELDEPNSAAKYAEVREWGQFFKELRERHNANIPLLITEQPWPDNKDWGTLDGSVNIWTAHVSDVWRDLEAPNAPRHIAKRLAAGEEVWTYTALVQTPAEWRTAHGNPKRLAAGQPPVWLTDFPAMNYRILGWLAPQHGITGLTYWDTSFWKGDDFDPWANNGTYPHDNDEVYNGDGFLLYPARQERHGREGPVASIRLKWIRESMDDHDYIALMAKHGFKKTALDTAQTFARGFGDWDDRPEALYQAREEIGNSLEKLASKHLSTNP